MKDFLDELVECPTCHKKVKDGDRIWLDGECLCPDCYKHKRNKITSIQNKAYNDGYECGYDNGYNTGFMDGLKEGRNFS